MSRDRHMIRNDVENLAQSAFRQAIAKTFAGFFAAEVLIDAVIIDHVVTVFAAGRGLQVWGTVNMRDPKFTEIIGHGGGVIESEPGM